MIYGITLEGMWRNPNGAGQGCGLCFSGFDSYPSPCKVVLMDYLLRGLKEIHQEFYTGKDGELVISFQAFKRRTILSGGKKVRMIRDMKRLGVLFRMVFGRPGDRKSMLCGWKSRIAVYFQVFYQKQYEEENPTEVDS